jgi:dual specificity phosphatase 3
MMANVSRITDRLLTGGDLPVDVGPDGMLLDLRDLQSEGVTHIIDNRSEWNDQEFVARYAPRIRYLHNGQDDNGQRMPDTWFDRGVGFALQALQAPGTTVLAHCHMGINRGPSMAFAILLAQGLDPVAALDAIRSARPIVGMAYAADALDWWHRSSGAPAPLAARRRAEFASWLAAHPLGVLRVPRASAPEPETSKAGAPGEQAPAFEAEGE